MILQVLNLVDIGQALNVFVQHVKHPAAKLWLKTIPKEYLLNLDGKLAPADREQNFVPWTYGFHQHYMEVPRIKLPATWLADWCRTGIRPKVSGLESFHFQPVDLPEWTMEALGSNQPLYLFDPTASMNKHGMWAKTEKIQKWLNSQPSGLDYAVLSFEDAAKNALDYSFY